MTLSAMALVMSIGVATAAYVAGYRDGRRDREDGHPRA